MHIWGPGTPTAGSEGRKEERTDRYAFRKAGMGWPVLALTEHPGGTGCLLYPVAQGGGMVAFS